VQLDRKELTVQYDREFDVYVTRPLFERALDEPDLKRRFLGLVLAQLMTVIDRDARRLQDLELLEPSPVTLDPRIPVAMTQFQRSLNQLLRIFDLELRSDCRARAAGKIAKGDPMNADQLAQAWAALLGR
jgi:hypothetical protein